jgi:hypothetical protein
LHELPLSLSLSLSFFLSADLLAASPPPPDYTLYRYLKARDWKFDAARDMIVETMKVRTTLPRRVFFGTFLF